MKRLILSSIKEGKCKIAYTSFWDDNLYETFFMTPKLNEKFLLSLSEGYSVNVDKIIDEHLFESEGDIYEWRVINISNDTKREVNKYMTYYSGCNDSFGRQIFVGDIIKFYDFGFSYRPSLSNNKINLSKWKYDTLITYECEVIFKNGMYCVSHYMLDDETEYPLFWVLNRTNEEMLNNMCEDDLKFISENFNEFNSLSDLKRRINQVTILNKG